MSNYWHGPSILVVGGDSQDKRKIEECIQSDSKPVAVEYMENLGSWRSGFSGSYHTVLLHDRVVGGDISSAVEHIKAGSPSLPVVVFTDQQKRSQTFTESGLTDVICTAELSAEGYQLSLKRVFDRARKRALLADQISRCVIDNNLDGVIALDTDGHVVLWNAHMERMFGISIRDALGERPDKLIPDLAKAGEFSGWQRALTGFPSVGEERFFHNRRDDVQSYYRAFYWPLNSADEVVGVAVLLRDLTDCKAAQLALAESDERFVRMADSNPNLLWLCRPDGERHFFNKRWLNFTGRSAQQEVGNGWMANVYSAHLQKVRDAIGSALMKRENYHVEYRLRTADGRYRWILESAVAQYLRNGVFIGFMGSCTDINETRMTQTAIIAIPQQQKLSPTPVSTHDHSPMGIWKLSPELTIAYVNPAVGTQLKMEHVSLIGSPFFDVLPGLPRDIFDPILKAGQQVRRQNHPIVLEEGSAVFWDIDAWPVKNENGTVVGIGMNTMEVTARLKIQQHREDLVATLVHDLKTPLVGADRAIQLLMQGVLGNVEPGQSEVLNLLRQSNQRLLSMVQNMIEVYRYELDKPKLFCEPLSVIALMRDSLAELNSIAQSKSVSLKSDFPERLGTISADRMALRRVFQNLLDNAMKFTPSGGSIVASATETDDTVTVSVADNGIGIPESDRPMIFQRFSQGKSGKAYATGTGLGLYLCRQIVEAHHGQISFSTNEGEGTTFSVILPKQQPMPEQPSV